MINSPVTPIDHSSFANQITCPISRLSKSPEHFCTLASFHLKAKGFNLCYQKQPEPQLCLSGQTAELFILTPRCSYLYTNTVTRPPRTSKGIPWGSGCATPESFLRECNLLKAKHPVLNPRQLLLPLQNPSNPRVCTSSIPSPVERGFFPLESSSTLCLVKGHLCAVTWGLGKKD